MNDRVRKTAFYLLMIVLVWGVVEIAAVAGHAVLDKHLFSPAFVREQARTITSRGRELNETERAPPAVPAGPRDDPSTGRWIETVHPYVGIVVDPDRHPPGAVSDLGFAQSPAVQTLLRPTGRKTRIGIFGGSFAAGIYRRLAKIDGAQVGGREVFAANFAKGGYKQPQQLMALTYLLALGVQLDVVVNVDGFNEVALPSENVARGVNPFFPRQWHLKSRGTLDSEKTRKVGYLEYLGSARRRRASWLLENRLFRSPAVALVWRALDRNLAASILDARRQIDQVDAGRVGFRLAKRSGRCLTAIGVSEGVVSLLVPLYGQSFDNRELLYQAAVSRLGAGRAAKHRRSIERCTVELSTAFAALGPKYVIASDQVFYRELAGMWQRSSLEMQALCDAYGIRYFHFLQPNQYLPGSKPMTREEQRIAISETRQYRRSVVDGYPLLREAGHELIDRGVAFTDLTMMFEHQREVLYADDCCHLNKKGYAAVVERILETIAADT